MSFVVNADLKALVYGANAGSSLFSFGQAEEQQPTLDQTPTTKETQPVVDQFQDLATSKYFFFHFEHPSLSLRSIANERVVFGRTTSMEEIERVWTEKKDELTLEFKRKHKTAFKRKIKLRTATKVGKAGR